MSLSPAIHWLIVFNPAAGGGAAKFMQPAIQQALERQSIHYHWVETTHRGHAVILVKEHIEQHGFRHIVAVGGDGTVNEVLNGMMLAEGISSQELTLAVMPAGTGNDWHKTFGKRPSYLNVISKMSVGETIPHDVGIVQCMDTEGNSKQRYFLNVAGMAYDAFVVQASVAQKRPVWMPSKIYYQKLIFSCLLSYHANPMKVEWTDEMGNTHHREGRFFSLNAGICKYNGGGALFCPQAKPDDGLLAFTIVGEVRKMDVIINTPKIYNGTILSHPKINGYDAREVKITHTDIAIPVEVDGEYVGVSPVQLSIIKHAINILRP